MYTVAEDIQRYEPVLSLEQLISRRGLAWLRVITFATAVLTGLASSELLLTLPAGYAQILFGYSLLATAFWIELTLLYSYHNSYYYHGLNSVLGEEKKLVTGCTYEVSAALYQNKADATAGFCKSELGRMVLLRSGITNEAIDTFLTSTRPNIAVSVIPLPPNEVFSLITLGNFLKQQDASFQQFLKSVGVTEEIFSGALTWVIKSHHAQKKAERWWGKDNLSKTKGLGREWSQGTPYLLEKFSRDIHTSAIFSTLTTSNSAFTEEKIAEVEIALARAKAANVLLIAEAGMGAIDLLLEVDRRLRKGASVGAVADQRLLVLDTSRLFATHKEKQELELTLLSLFTEAIEAGNIIIVIENLSAFVREAEALGVFIPELLDQFLASPALHVVATDTPGAYHTYLEPLGGFSRRFAEVLIDSPNLKSTTAVLQSIALQNEKRYQTLFTYPGLVAITNCADRYLVEGVMPDKAIELFFDVATRAAQQGVTLVTSEFVLAVVSEKTGIPVGPITDSERDLLLNLEDRLHERVIGQEQAITAIARTMRRARAGIQSSEKPIGSFLFLGPTGVGKTETAKALAFTFFGSEENMHRIDMSEFSGEESLMRLIGSTTESGILSNMLREHPYAVLLLDEFEKGARAVHDIFLQILDEGFFTDGSGQRVNARNTIIIATSNAGSDLILRTVAERQALAPLTQEIINHIVKIGVYRPELINRFDSTIIFEPLEKEAQGQIAGLLLSNLYTRVKERGYELVVNRDLIDIIVEQGYSPEFGARKMQRVLQDVIEEKIAEQIIGGTLELGATIHLTKADFSDLELALG